PVEEWDKNDLERSSWNNKGLYAIFNGVSGSEYRRIMTCTTSKEAWDVLQVTHEGTRQVRKSRVQMLTSSFELLRMEENESFSDFYAKLNDIVNTSFNLGETISNKVVVNKILRSLPDRFQPKVTAIEESKDVDLIRVDELCGSLQAFELTLRQSKKSKSIALKSVKEDVSMSD
ncbi:retrotransposon gag domain-containing protein, partial [Solirubrobacter sp. CPCC 204708]|nr:retrotransposon gag domain-containing protein [Solirubrobacter deserti]